MKYWKIIADISMTPVGVWAVSQPWISGGRTIWIVDAHRDGKRFVVRSDGKLIAFMELEAALTRPALGAQP